MKLYRTPRGPVVRSGSTVRLLEGVDWDELTNSDDVTARLNEAVDGSGEPVDSIDDGDLLAPIGTAEIWAAGVTYYRSRSARMEEASEAGGSDFYDRVYDADRPELFFKATPNRVVGPGGHVRIRGDATWNVPEPELTLAINRRGRIYGYTIGNDMSSRDIEGANPLYLPQAKVYDRCAAVGPCILVADEAPARQTAIELRIQRHGAVAFEGTTSLEQLKRDPEELVEYLYRDNTFPAGCLLMTGTGIVPPNDFTLRSGDRIQITIAPIGTLVNDVA
ncbi:MAG: 2-hydroxyhepta-2,4-diene-1,7-dioate isomerase [Phycisphaeraceae bacterium]|nr:2-hydroxyhepta-2,4-diene-1,7-dioate isomerase [Phycisphaeraceae bacterium]